MKALRVGVLSGIAAGVVFAVWSMAAMWITGSGLWLPLNLIAHGIIFIAVVWPIMQYGVWYQLDEDAAEGFNDWIFAGAHLIFGLTAAGMATLTIADDGSARGRHAAGRRPLQQPL